MFGNYTLIQVIHTNTHAYFTKVCNSTILLQGENYLKYRDFCSKLMGNNTIVDQEIRGIWGTSTFFPGWFGDVFSNAAIIELVMLFNLCLRIAYIGKNNSLKASIYAH